MRNMTQNRDISIPVQSISELYLLAKTFHYVRARSRIIGDLISFKSRAGRFVFLESLLDYLTETKGVPGLKCYRMDTDTCLNHVKSQRSACDAHWTFGNIERWESDQCCGILALHKTNWTAGKRIPEADTVRWAINDRINRLLVLCLPPEDFVAPHEQTWEAVCEEVPWAAVRDTSIRRLVRCPRPDGSRYKVLEAFGDKGDGINEPEIDKHTDLSVVRKRVLAPQVTERYVRLSYLGDVLPWLREKVLPVAEAEDAGLARTVAQCIADIELRPAHSAGDGGAAIREVEIRQKIKIEIAFQALLVAALDKEGYFVKNFKAPDEREEASIREKYENDPDLSLHCWRCFRVYSKDASAPFRLTVWFSGDAPVPSTFNWRALDVDAVSVAGPSICKVSNGVSLSDASPSLCYHVSIIDARLRFETLPLPVMRDTLLGGHLAEELASKVAVAFERIRAILADCEEGGESLITT